VGARKNLAADIECLPEIVDAVKGKVPVLIDGGIRRGTDVFKALAMGATAVGIGRPTRGDWRRLDSQASKAVLAIMRRELETIMRQAGTPSVAGITKALSRPDPNRAGKQTTDEKASCLRRRPSRGGVLLLLLRLGPRSTSWWSKQTAPDCSSGG